MNACGGLLEAYWLYWSEICSEQCSRGYAMPFNIPKLLVWANRGLQKCDTGAKRRLPKLIKKQDLIS